MTRETAINLLDNLIGMVEDNQQSDYDEAFKLAIRSLKSWDEDITTVIHGEWVMNDDQVYECKDCGYVPSFDAYTYFNYCPNCGARMEGEV